MWERLVFDVTKEVDNIGKTTYLTTLKLELKVYSGNMSRRSMMEMRKEGSLK